MFKKQMKKQNADRKKFTKGRNSVTPKIITPPENQYDLPPTRA